MAEGQLFTKNIWACTLSREYAMELASILQDSWTVCVACGHRRLGGDVDITKYNHFIYSGDLDCVCFRYPYPVDRGHFLDDLHKLVPPTGRSSIEIL
jgi:hypothetical protein